MPSSSNAKDSLLLIPKGNYIIMSFAYYCVYTFRSSFLELYLGDKSKDGWFGAVCALGTFLGGLFWAKCADASGDFTGILMICSALSSMSFFCFFWLHPWSPGLFALSMGIFFVYSFFQASFPSLTDALTLRCIPDKGLYGRQRLFGTVAYGVITFIISNMCASWGWICVFPAICTLNLGFILYIFCLLRNPEHVGKKKQKEKKDDEEALNENAAVVNEQRKDQEIQNNSRQHSEENSKATPQQINSLKQSSTHSSSSDASSSSHLGYAFILRQKRFVYVMLIVFLVGYVRGIFTVFLSRYQKDVIGATMLVSTLATNAGIILEIPVFFWGNSILQRFGVEKSLLAALTLGLARSMGYVGLSFLARRSPHLHVLWGIGICGLELFKGPIFALTHGAAIKIVLSEIPLPAHGRAQGLYTVIYNNLSMLFGSLTGQLINNMMGPKDAMGAEEKERAVFWSGNALFGLTAVLTFVAILLAGGRMVFRGPDGAKPTSEEEEAQSFNAGQDDDVEKKEPIEEKEKESISAGMSSSSNRMSSQIQKSKALSPLQRNVDDVQQPQRNHHRKGQ